LQTLIIRLCYQTLIAFKIDQNCNWDDSQREPKLHFWPIYLKITINLYVKMNPQSVREFLKPDWRKFSIFLLIFLIIIITHNQIATQRLFFHLGLSALCGYYYTALVRQVNQNLTQLNLSEVNITFEEYVSSVNMTSLESKIIRLPFFFPIFLLGMDQTLGYLFFVLPERFNLGVTYSFEFFNIVGVEILRLVSLFFYWYFLSCSMVWLYDKFKEMSQKE